MITPQTRGYFFTEVFVVGSPTQFVWHLPINIEFVTTGINKVLTKIFVYVI
jgi:hypothetical protein